jgi:TonB family protein
MSRITTQSLFETSVHKSSWQSYVVSTTVHAGLAAMAFAVVVPVAVEVRKSFEHVRIVAPVPEYKPKPPVQHLVAPKTIVHEVVRPPVKTFIPPPVVLPPVKREQIVEAPEIKPVQQPLPDIKVELPPAPKAPVKTGVFLPATELAKAAPAQQKLQVGGFGDPHGVQPSDASRSGPVTLAKVGAFDMPEGSGHGGAGGKAQNGGAVRQVGFGNGGETGRPKIASNGETIKPTAFGDATMAPPVSKKPVQVVETATPVQILFKPKPVYTAEARNMRLEGEVSLQVVFQANGTIRVLRVVNGLGHGLDEAAQQAAARVRFKPATRGGVAVDTNATIKISFELT